MRHLRAVEVDWRPEAACRGGFPELFDPEDNMSAPLTNHRRAEIEQVKDAYCAGCPVLASCGAYADRHKYVGLWGGVWRNLDYYGIHVHMVDPHIPVEFRPMTGEREVGVLPEVRMTRELRESLAIQDDTVRPVYWW